MKTLLYIIVQERKLTTTVGAFDYWGKGTAVTVTSAQTSAPKSIFALSQCSADSDGFLTVGCLTRGFSPADSLTFKWKDAGDKDLNTFVQYPAFGSDGDYTKISHMRVKKSDWNPQNPYICEASNSNGNLTTKVAPVKPQTPTLSLVPVTTPKSTSVMCVIEDFYPKNLTGQWKVNDNTRSLKLESKRNGGTGLYTAYSFYEVSSETWNVNTSYSCEVTHQGQTIIEKKNFKAKFTLTLKPPIERELFVNDKVVLEAVVSGDVQNTVQEASVSCTVKNKHVDSKNITQGNVFPDTSNLWIRIHNVTIDKKTWFDGEKVTCTIRDANNKRDIKQEIHVDKGDGQKPNVTIYRLDTSNSVSESVYLVCEVTSHKLGDVYIMWKVGNKPYIEASTSVPIHQKSSTSVLSILTVSKQEYEDLQTTITCAVKHANMDDNGSPLQVSSSKSKQPPCPVCSHDY